MATEIKSLQTFITSIPQITKLSLRAHILLIAYHWYHFSHQSDFGQVMLKNAFIKVRLPYDETKAKNQLRELAQGDSAPLINAKDSRYALSIHGDEEIKTYLKNKPQIETGIIPLRSLMQKIMDSNQKAFLTEAISCAETKSFRASIIMMWLFVIDHLQNYALKKERASFNNALGKRPDAKKLRSITTKDDFEYMKESIFIEILQSANIISKSVRKILDTKLDTRNTCAHPANIIIKESTVVEFVESLVDNVVLKYK